jgi:polysaccharide deacetylase 2 family uncharacterized protein YibQ
LLNAPIEENQKRLFDILGMVPGYAGIVSGKDHTFTAQDIVAAPMMKQIYGRGLAFVESNPGAVAYGQEMAKEFGYPYAQNNLWLDADLRPEKVDLALKAMELQATQRGRVVAFTRPYPAVLNKVQEWIAASESKGIQIAPLSAVVQ